MEELNEKYGSMLLEKIEDIDSTNIIEIILVTLEFVESNQMYICKMTQTRESSELNNTVITYLISQVIPDISCTDFYEKTINRLRSLSALHSQPIQQNADVSNTQKIKTKKSFFNK